jgi:transposase
MQQWFGVISLGWYPPVLPKLNDVVCGHYLKGLYWDLSGMCLFAKRLERHKFVWPPIVDGTLTLTPAQLALLVEAMDWRRTIAPPAPPRPMLV